MGTTHTMYRSAVRFNYSDLAGHVYFAYLKQESFTVEVHISYVAFKFCFLDIKTHI